jgi:tocopherol O-methyltransferase
MTSSLSEQIAQFYDTSSGLWESLWGEHMHHGYYGKNGNYRLDRRQAQVDLIEELLHWGKVTQPAQILDVGCGIGGSTLYLAQKYNAIAQGITLSPVQAKRATARAQAAGLGEQVSFQVADALAMPFANNQFDLLWSLESGEHMPNKPGFLAECYRVLKPGGIFLMATWCHRPTDSLAGELTLNEQNHLQEIYRVYCLPYVLSLPVYRAIATEVGFQTIRSADWSLAVAPFWERVIESALTPQAIAALLQSGWTTIQGALALDLMKKGYDRGLIRFGLLSGIKAGSDVPLDEIQ